MKKFYKILLITTVSLLSAVTIFLSAAVGITSNASGGYNGVCEISSDSKEWIIDNFSEYETPDELMGGIFRFALQNFTYEDMKYFLIQTADFDKFIGENDFHGVCFEFSVFAKTVALVWAEDKGVALSAYICNVWYWKGGKRQGHSFNYFEYDGKVVYLDLTHDNTHFKNREFDKIRGPGLCKTDKKSVTKSLYPKSYSTYI